MLATQGYGQGGAIATFGYGGYIPTGIVPPSPEIHHHALGPFGKPFIRFRKEYDLVGGIRYPIPDKVFEILGDLQYPFTDKELDLIGTLIYENKYNVELRGNLKFNIQKIMNVKGKTKLSKEVLFLLLLDDDT
jgi:hypothetical protein